MKIGIRSPLTGLIASAPIGDAGLLAVGRQALDLGLGRGLRRRTPRPRPRRSGAVSSATSGCSGARTMNVAPNSVSGPRREDAQLVAAGVMRRRRGLEHDLAALAPADPVRLHGPDRLGPVDAREVEQLVGVVRDAQVPLRAARASRPWPRSASSGGRRPRPARGPASRRSGTSRPPTSAGRPGRPSGTAGRTTGSSGSTRGRR